MHTWSCPAPRVIMSSRGPLQTTFSRLVKQIKRRKKPTTGIYITHLPVLYQAWPHLNYLLTSENLLTSANTISMCCLASPLGPNKHMYCCCNEHCQWKKRCEYSSHVTRISCACLLRKLWVAHHPLSSALSCTKGASFRRDKTQQGLPIMCPFTHDRNREIEILVWLCMPMKFLSFYLYWLIIYWYNYIYVCLNSSEPNIVNNRDRITHRHRNVREQSRMDKRALCGKQSAAELTLWVSVNVGSNTKNSGQPGARWLLSQDERKYHVVNIQHSCTADGSVGKTNI